jgi:protein-export chaperone SecB
VKAFDTHSHPLPELTHHFTQRSKNYHERTRNPHANPVFAIEKIYIKDLSVEVPNAPQIFLEREAPKVSIQLQTNAQGIGEGVFEVTLTTTVTSKIEEKTVFLVEVGQAGIFRVQNVPSENMEPCCRLPAPTFSSPTLAKSFPMP